jgi:hypothetical protein
MRELVADGQSMCRGVQETTKRIREGLSFYWIISPTRQQGSEISQMKRALGRMKLKIEFYQTVP